MSIQVFVKYVDKWMEYKIHFILIHVQEYVILANVKYV
jgi:hypothetical protein